MILKKEFLLNGVYHNTNGPAVVYGDGTVEYWINGVDVTSTVQGLIESGIKEKNALASVLQSCDN